MKRIILSDGEKKKYEERIKEVAIKRNKRSYGEEYKKHPKWIKRRNKRLAKEERRRDRQLSRQEKKKKPLECFYKSRPWRELRFKILRKIGFKCLGCGRGAPAVILHVDHIKPRIKFPELELDEENLQVLCEDCNIGKSYQFEDDLRLDRG